MTPLGRVGWGLIAIVAAAFGSALCFYGDAAFYGIGSCLMLAAGLILGRKVLP